MLKSVLLAVIVVQGFQMEVIFYLLKILFVNKKALI